MEERTDEAFELDQRLTVLGAKLVPGQMAPEFELEALTSPNAPVTTVRLADSAGRVRLLNVVNSLDTPVCHVETRQWDQLRAGLPPEVVVYTISMDLPFAQARWRAAEDVGHEALSAHKSEQFGVEYGVLITEWRLLQRAVFVLDGAGRVAYAEYVADQMREPDYAAAVAAAKEAAANN